jgi:hypothetical protein
MRKWVWVLALAAASTQAQVPVTRIAEDAKVVDRVAEASRKDLPNDLLKRILNEDLELLRGKRSDGSYQHATYERMESGRSDDSYSIQPRKDDQLEHFQIRGAWVYRLVVSSPSRRMLVTKNRRVWLDRVELEYIPQGSSTTRTETVKVEQWLDPGQNKPIDFPDVARQATARVYARADAKAGYGNVVVTLIRARVVDHADSPYAEAVAALKAVLRGIDNNDIPSIRAMSQRLHESLGGRAPAVAEPAASTVSVVETAPADPNLYSELLEIEDLLTGTEAERRQGLDRLHQVVRRLRAR